MLARLVSGVLWLVLVMCTDLTAHAQADAIDAARIEARERFDLPG